MYLHLQCARHLSTFSFPSLEGPGPTSLRAPPPGPVCISDIDERTVSAVCAAEGGGGGGGGGADGGGGGVGPESCT